MKAVILDGIVLGLQFGLLGVGLTLVYGLGGVLNLAHGSMAVFGAIVVANAMDAGAPVLLAVGLGLLSVGVLGLVLDATLMRAVYRLVGESRVLLSLLLTARCGVHHRWAARVALPDRQPRHQHRWRSDIDHRCTHAHGKPGGVRHIDRCGGRARCILPAFHRREGREVGDPGRGEAPGCAGSIQRPFGA